MLGSTGCGLTAPWWGKACSHCPFAGHKGSVGFTCMPGVTQHPLLLEPPRFEFKLCAFQVHLEYSGSGEQQVRRPQSRSMFQAGPRVTSEWLQRSELGSGGWRGM